jgi:hypothetical protein
MEPLWSPVVATGGNRSQIARPRKRLNQAKTVAAGCDQLPFEAHGKEGVDGSSPSEGSAKAAQRDFLLWIGLHVQQRALGMEPIMELSDLEGRREGGVGVINHSLRRQLRATFLATVELAPDGDLHGSVVSSLHVLDDGSTSPGVAKLCDA